MTGIFRSQTTNMYYIHFTILQMSGIDQYQSSGEYSTFASGHQGILPNPSGFEGYFPIPPCHACAIVPIHKSVLEMTSVIVVAEIQVDLYLVLNWMRKMVCDWNCFFWCQRILHRQYISWGLYTTQFYFEGQ